MVTTIPSHGNHFAGSESMPFPASRCVHLAGAESSLILLGRNDSLPEVIYWGRRCDLTGEAADDLSRLLEPPVPQGLLDEGAPVTLLPSPGDGVFHCSALSGHNNGSAWAPRFRHCSVREAGRDHLHITAEDAVAKLRVSIELRLSEEDMLQESMELTNLGSHEYYLEHLGLSLVLPDTISSMTQFHGRWIHEFQPSHSRWDQPHYYVENLKGRTSSDNPPLLMLGEPGCREEAGNVYAFHLAWSGNHCYRLMTLQDGRRLVQFGERLLPGEIVLAPGESYRTPVLYATFSGRGYNGVSASFHRFIRESPALAPRVLPYRPVHFNTWEAMYFQHDLATLRKLLDRAAEIGIERFILDDGWFQGRRHERAGLGDWYVDREKYPGGLAPFIDEVLARGMEFGLWFEPEMVNPDSELYRAHPDWILEIAGYDQPMGRSQYALNLANPDAYSYIHQRMHSLLSSHRISYVKWDMNRDLVQAGAGRSRPGVHGQVLATYRLLAQLRDEFPSLEIESCASGGARADLGILRYTSRLWTSDTNDPLERQTIQQGFSYFFPPELMGAHVGPERAHSTGRAASLEYRVLTCFFGHMGLELNLLELSDEECGALKYFVALYKKYRALMHSGRFVRLDRDNNGQSCCGVINDERTRGIFTVAQNGFPGYAVSPPLKLDLFNHSLSYRVSLLNGQENTGYLMKKKPAICSGSLTANGGILAHLGIQLPVMHPQSILLLLIEHHHKE